MNINSAIIHGAKVLKDNFIKNPYLDSEILMTKAIEKDRKYILLNSKRVLDKKDLNTFQKLITVIPGIVFIIGGIYYLFN